MENADEEVDRIVREVIAATGVPGASVALVKDAQIVSLRAWGDAKLSPRGKW